jgi:hypothetical protein
MLRQSCSASLNGQLKTHDGLCAKCMYNDDHEAALKEALEILEKTFGTVFKVADQKIEDIAKAKELSLMS